MRMLLVAVMLAASACGRLTTDADPLRGTFTLERLNDHALPTLFGSAVEMRSSRLMLNSDGSYATEDSMRYTATDGSLHVARVSGRWERQGSQVTLVNRFGVRLVGEILGEKIVVEWGPGDLRTYSK